MAGHVAPEGTTVVLAGWEGEVKGLFAFGDSVRSEAKEAVEACRLLGLHVALITGDNWQAAFQVGRELGIKDVRASPLPSSSWRLLGSYGRSLRRPPCCSAVFSSWETRSG